MLMPVRCFTCGSLIADKFPIYQSRIREEEPGDVLDSLNIHRYCCRRMLLTSVETMHQIIPFYEAMYRQNKKFRTDIN